MSDWGDDELEGVEAQPIDVDEPDGPTFGVDVRSLAGHLVDAAVQSAVGKEVSTAAHEAVKKLMTPEVREAIRRRADEAGELAEGPVGRRHGLAAVGEPEHQALGIVGSRLDKDRARFDRPGGGGLGPRADRFIKIGQRQIALIVGAREPFG